MTAPPDTPSLGAIADFFFEQEARLDLVDATPRGLPLWPAMRVKAGQVLAERLGFGQAPHLPPRRRASLRTRLVRRARHLTTWNPFRWEGTCDVVLLEHTRTIEHEGRRVDVHSEDWPERLRARGDRVRVLSAPYSPGFDKDFGPERASTEVILEAGWLEPCARFDTLPLGSLRVLGELERAARARFGVDFGVVPLALRRYHALSGRTNLYERLLERWQPREVYLVEGYGLNVALIAAADRLGIPTNEIQHGTFGPTHLGYAYPNRPRAVPGFSKRLFVWNDEWRRRVPFSPEVARVEVAEPSFLARRREKYAGVTKEPLVTVLSQGLLGDRVAEAFARVRSRFENHRILYKLHPGEFARSDRYASLRRLEADHGIEIVHDADLGELLARSDAVVGVYSTALYEALDLDCRVFLLDLPGVEASRHLVDEGRAEILGERGPPLLFVPRALAPT